MMNNDKPLIRKLGVREDARLLAVDAPDGFSETLGDLPDGARFVGSDDPVVDLILFFARDRATVESIVPLLAGKLTTSGALWVAWPKKASRVPTDLSFDSVQRAGLAYGLVDTKICAIDATWSALRFVVRLRDREKGEA
jgi:hypothetical protein